ncbi:hypothetical protein H9P43_005030 [Blastocladiella emersonii ATCC 22665]|nr:hypothetical protein H9P43_005030 [Blastocladiella emersonii ATCC 22665]
MSGAIPIHDRLLVESCEALLAFLADVLASRSALYDDANLRCLHATLPALCTALFGSARSLGWIHRNLPPEHERAVMALLLPSGPLMAVLLEHAANRDWLYQVDALRLPDATAALLAAGKLDELPDLYRGRVHVPPGIDVLARLSADYALAGHYAAGPGSPVAVTLNMFEFFTFYFCWALVGGRSTLGTAAATHARGSPTTPTAATSHAFAAAQGIPNPPGTATAMPPPQQQQPPRPYGGYPGPRPLPARPGVVGGATYPTVNATGAGPTPLYPQPQLPIGPARIAPWYTRLLQCYLAYFIPTSIATQPEPRQSPRSYSPTFGNDGATAEPAASTPMSPLKYLNEMSRRMFQRRGSTTGPAPAGASANAPAGKLAANPALADFGLGRFHVFVPLAAGIAAAAENGFGAADALSSSSIRRPSASGSTAAEYPAAALSAGMLASARSSSFYGGLPVSAAAPSAATATLTPIAAAAASSWEAERLACSQFFVECIVECWLGQSDYGARAFKPVPVDVLKALADVVDHVAVPELLECLHSHVPTQVLNLSRIEMPSRDQFGQMALKNAYLMLGAPLYRFLTLALTHAPVADKSLHYAVTVWTRWLTPIPPQLWTAPPPGPDMPGDAYHHASSVSEVSHYRGQADADAVEPFVIDNLAAYTRLLAVFLDRVRREFQLVAPRPIPAASAAAGAVVPRSGELGILDTVLNVFVVRSQQHPHQAASRPIAAVVTRRPRSPSTGAQFNWKPAHRASTSPPRTAGPEPSAARGDCAPSHYLGTVLQLESLLCNVPSSRARWDHPNTIVSALAVGLARLEGNAPKGGQPAAAAAVSNVASLLFVLAERTGKSDVGRDVLEQMLEATVVRGEMLRPHSRGGSLHVSPERANQALPEPPGTPRASAAAPAAGGMIPAAATAAIAEYSALATEWVKSTFDWLTTSSSSATTPTAATFPATPAAARSMVVGLAASYFAPRASPLQLQTEQKVLYRLAQALACLLHVSDTEYRDLQAAAEARVAMRRVAGPSPSTSTTSWFASPTRSIPATPSVLPPNVDQLDMSHDQLLVSSAGRIQLLDSARKCPPVPRLYPGQLARDLYHSTELPVLVDLGYAVADTVEAVLLRAARGVHAAAEGWEDEDRAAIYAGVLAWILRLVARGLVAAAGRPLNVRWIADRRTVIWAVVIMAVWFGGGRYVLAAALGLALLVWFWPSA